MILTKNKLDNQISKVINFLSKHRCIKYAVLQICSPLLRFTFCSLSGIYYDHELLNFM